MTGIELIAKERQEQIEKHGISVEHDVRFNRAHQLGNAAAVLATEQGQFTARKRLGMMPLDWDDAQALKMCKKNHKERLIIAGALIAAELDRISAEEEKEKDLKE